MSGNLENSTTIALVSVKLKDAPTPRKRPVSSYDLLTEPKLDHIRMLAYLIQVNVVVT